VRHRWADLLGDLLDRLLLAMDVLKEEQVALWLRFHPPGQGIGAAGAGLEPAAYVPSYSGQDPEDERFSRDAEWMARTVLIAKNTFVWLDQLSRAYGRAITRLDQIPDLALPSSPFPAYRFDGPNLSDDDRVEIKIEDHYYDRSDAGVVFRRVDRWSGDTRFVYHGNDGTSFPWNDTAQLDFTRADVREAVVQTIVRVARDFPIIRFDAAMTLTKRHFQRLWFPEPGSGGAIPSRAERGLSRAEFDATM